MNLERISNGILDVAKNTVSKAEIPKATSIANGTQKIQNALDGLAASNSVLVQKIVILSPEEKLATLIQKGVSEGVAKEISELSDEQYSRFIDLFDKNTNQFFAKEIAKFSKERYKLYTEYINSGLSFSNAKALSALNEAQRKKVASLVQKGVGYEEGIRLSQYEGEEFEKVVNLIDEGVYGVHMLEISTLDDEQFDTVTKLVKVGLCNGEDLRKIACGQNKESEKFFSLVEKGIDAYNAQYICVLGDANYSKIMKTLDHGGDGSQFWNILDLSDNQYERLLSLLDKGLKENIAYYVALLGDKEYENALKLINKGFRNFNILEISRFEDKKFDKVLNLMTRGLSEKDSVSLAKMHEQKAKQIISLLENGFDYNKAIEIVQNPQECDKLIQEIKSTPNFMRDFLDSENYSAMIKQATQGKYQTELIKLLSPETMMFTTRKALLESKIGIEDFLAGIKKLSKSTFKSALDSPNQYLNNIPVEYTIKTGDKYLQLPPEVLASQQKEMMKFFGEHIGELTRAAKYLDIDTINQLMDKRTNKFAEELENLDKLSDENYSLLSKLIKCKSANKDKILTSKEKIQLCQLVQIYQKAGIDASSLFEMVSNGKVDIRQAKQKIQYEILKASGIKELKLSDIPMEKLQFNEEFSYLALKDGQNIFDGEEGEMMRENLKEIVEEYRGITDKEAIKEVVDELKHEIFQDTPLYKFDEEIIEATKKMEAMFENMSEYSDEEAYEILYNFARLGYAQFMKNDELYTVIRESVLGDFSKFISNTSNKYGKINAQTQELFEQTGLDFNKWLSPDIEDVDFKVAGKKMKIRLWDRYPQEDLFMGNKTTCCTAIGTGGNGGSTPLYLLNKAFNVVNLLDEKGNLVGMSRVYMSEINGKPSLVIDNIELNNSFVKGMSDEDKKIIRDNVFKYANAYVENITGNAGSQVYFSPSYCKVGTSDLVQEKAEATLIGKINQNKVYINAAKGWINPDNPITEKGEQVKWLLVPKAN